MNQKLYFIPNCSFVINIDICEIIPSKQANKKKILNFLKGQN